MICVQKVDNQQQAIPIPDYKLKFSDMYITYDRIILKDVVHAAYSELLMKTSAIYPYTVTEIRTKSFEEGKRSVIWNNCYSGLVPDQVVVCMNKLDAADREKTRDILNFERFNIEC